MESAGFKRKPIRSYGQTRQESVENFLATNEGSSIQPPSKTEVGKIPTASATVLSISEPSVRKVETSKKHRNYKPKNATQTDVPSLDQPQGTSIRDGQPSEQSVNNADLLQKKHPHRKPRNATQPKMSSLDQSQQSSFSQSEMHSLNGQLSEQSVNCLNPSLKKRRNRKSKNAKQPDVPSLDQSQRSSFNQSEMHMLDGQPGDQFAKNLDPSFKERRNHNPKNAGQSDAPNLSQFQKSSFSQSEILSFSGQSSEQFVNSVDPSLKKRDNRNPKNAGKSDAPSLNQFQKPSFSLSEIANFNGQPGEQFVSVDPSVKKPRNRKPKNADHPGVPSLNQFQKPSFSQSEMHSFNGKHREQFVNSADTSLKKRRNRKPQNVDQVDGPSLNQFQEPSFSQSEISNFNGQPVEQFVKSADTSLKKSRNRKPQNVDQLEGPSFSQSEVPNVNGQPGEQFVHTVDPSLKKKRRNRKPQNVDQPAVPLNQFEKPSFSQSEMHSFSGQHSEQFLNNEDRSFKQRRGRKPKLEGPIFSQRLFTRYTSKATTPDGYQFIQNEYRHHREEKDDFVCTEQASKKNVKKVYDWNAKGFQDVEKVPGFNNNQSKNGKRNKKTQADDQKKGLKNRRKLFEDYWTEEKVAEEMQSGRIIKGVIRINRTNTYEAYITTGSGQDVLVYSPSYRNRALDGDLVAAIFLDEEESKKTRKGLAEKLEDRKIKEQTRLDKCLPPGISADCLNYGDSKEDYELVKVVYIFERKHQFCHIGTLSLDSQGKSIGKKCALFRPRDKKVPFFAIPRQYISKEFAENHEHFANILYSAVVIDWPSHCAYPFAKLIGPVGQIGEIPVETEAIMLTHGIQWDETFTEEVEECLPETPWTIPDKEYQDRLDLTSLNVFSIDPATARDLDDALHIRNISNNLFEVGVHIADVSHFVLPQTALDEEARSRSTTVYLVQKAVPMLPRLLCEELCSLNPGVDRLSFSVIFKMTDKGKVVGTPWFGKSIIRSKAKLSYDHAQAFIENFESWEEANLVGNKELTKVDLFDGCTEETIKTDVLKLYRLSRHLRQGRFENGALKINNFKHWFSLDEYGNPAACGIYQIKESNELIEEFMLLANMAVAKKIAAAYPEVALLRRHPAPKEKLLREFGEYAQKLGFEEFGNDISSAGDLQRAFNSVKNPIHRTVLEIICTKPLQRAVYFCSGDPNVKANEMNHYALNVDLYTHFTSPIRRYCDLIVHRMLYSAIKQCSGRGGMYKIVENRSIVDDLVARGSVDSTLLDLYTTDEITDVAAICNARKDSSKGAQDASQKLYLCAYLATKYGKSLSKDEQGDLHQFAEEAIVYRVNQRSFDVLIFALGIECRCWVEDLVEKDLIWGSHLENDRLSIFWKDPQVVSDNVLEYEESLVKPLCNIDLNNESSFVQTIEVFQTVPVFLKVLFYTSPPTFKVILRDPRQDWTVMHLSDGSCKGTCPNLMDQD